MENDAPRMKFPSASFWTSILAFVAILSAIVAFVQYFMAQAQELKDDQRELRGWTKEISEQVDENTTALAMIFDQVNENTVTLERNSEEIMKLTEEISTINSGIEFLLCSGPNGDSGWEGCP